MIMLSIYIYVENFRQYGIDGGVINVFKLYPESHNRWVVNCADNNCANVENIKMKL